MTARKPLIETNSWLFSKLLQEGLFKVPWHQRYYDWNSDHVRELLSDIEEAIIEERQCYFLGTVILVKKESTRWEINDGQQRMITFSLICAALCRRFAENGSGSHYETRALRILFDLDPGEACTLNNAQDYSPRIFPQRDDKVSYWSMIRGNSVGANGILTTAWREIEDFISSQTLRKSKDYFDFIVQKLEIACLEVPAIIDPNAVYEAINCRGKELDDLDLIRNHIYSHFYADQYHVRRNSVHERLERIRTRFQAKRKASEYLRCHLQCLFGFLRKDRFYREVCKEIKNQARQAGMSLPDYAFVLSEKVAEPMSLSLFSEVITSTSPDPITIEAFNSHSRTTDSPRNLAVLLWELKGYTVTQPLVFALLTTYLRESDGRRKIRIARIVHNQLSNLATFLLRTAFAAPKFEPSHFEEKFSNYAAKIMQDEEISSTEFAEFLIECDQSYLNILDDSKFEERLCEAQMTGNNKIKRFLFGINVSPPRSFRVFKDHELTVEYILPTSDTHWENWPAFEGKDPRDWVNRIGNLTLLTRTDNKPGAKFNKSFKKKREIYEGSPLSITSRLAAYDDWTPASIIDRQQLMAKRAIQVWRLTNNA